jgi:hypothetical protein
MASEMKAPVHFELPIEKSQQKSKVLGYKIVSLAV